MPTLLLWLAGFVWVMPGIEVPGPVVLDLGEPIAGEMVPFSVLLYNPIAGSFEVRSAAGGCGALDTQATRIAALGLGRVQGNFDTTGLRGFVQRNLEIPLAGRALITLQIRAQVLPPFTAAPRALILRPGETAPRLTIKGPRPFTVTAIRSEAGVLRARLGGREEALLHRLRLDASDLVGSSEILIDLRSEAEDYQISVPILHR